VTRRGKIAGTAGRKKNARLAHLSDLEVRERLQQELMEKLAAEDYKPKVADLLRILNSKARLKLEADGRQKFWELIEQLRREELQQKEEEKDKQDEEDEE